ncbi:hypothetical protein GBAR_LOCUS12927, partial [Geodia barretti]
MPVVYSHCWSRTVMESLTERGLKPPDHVVLDDHRNKGLCPLSLLLSSTLTVLVSYCCRYILLYANNIRQTAQLYSGEFNEKRASLGVIQ